MDRLAEVMERITTEPQGTILYRGLIIEIEEYALFQEANPEIKSILEGHTDDQIITQVEATAGNNAQKSIETPTRKPRAPTIPPSRDIDRCFSCRQFGPLLITVL